MSEKCKHFRSRIAYTNYVEGKPLQRGWFCGDCGKTEREIELEAQNAEQTKEIERLKNQEKLRIDAENDKIKLGELLVVWNRIGRAITQSCEGHEEHDVENLLAQIKDVSTEELFETKLKIEIERDRYCRLYVNACKNLEAQ